MAGSISLSLSQQFDALGKPLAGGKLYLFAAGTTTPQSAYQDSALTLPYPDPIVLDSAGRIPQFFLADGSIKIRLADADGVTQVAADGILVVGASSGGGGGSPVDATTVLTTGDIKIRYGTGVLAGFVRLNGRTIGSATSGASERANADCQPLFEYLWGADANLSVSGGRGVSANADWVANKTLALPDARGRNIAGLDDMGASSAARLSSILSSTTLGGAGGTQTSTLNTNNLPPYTPTGIVTGSASVAIGVNKITVGSSGTPIDVDGQLTTGSGSLQNATFPINISSLAIELNAQGGTSLPFNSAPPTIVMTVYQKL